MVFHLYKDSKGEWRWKLLAANNKIIADSAEGYRHRVDCIDAMKLIKGGIDSANAYDITQSPVVFIPI
jgi:uncharacterized protein YegP (UPF0339 family)